MKLPIFQSPVQELSLLQTNWASILNPIISNPANQSIILLEVDLINGTTIVNHRLGRKLQGWKIVRQDAAAAIYDSQNSNQSQELTLILNSDADVTVNIEVF